MNESALCELLKTKAIAGAYLDAFIEEPLPSENELWDLENVIISPHDSATCKDNDNRVIKIFEENFFFQGQVSIFLGSSNASLLLAFSISQKL